MKNIIKYRNKHLFLILAFSLNCFNLICQDTIVLNQTAQGYLTKILGSKYFKLKYEPISLSKIKSLKNVDAKTFKHATITEISNIQLNTSAIFKSKYILIIENSNEFIVYENFNDIDFKDAKQIFKSEYGKEFNDLKIKLITDEFNVVDITMNFHDEKENATSDTLNRIFIMYYRNEAKYNTYEYEKNKFVSIGLKDDNFDGKIEPNIDYFFCDRSNAKYFFINGTTKMCNYLSKNNYLVIDSSHIYRVNLLQNKTDAIILEKTDQITSSFYDKVISVFNKAPMHLEYDSLNAVNLKISDLFTTNRYVYFDFVISRCKTCLSNLPKLDSLTKLYNKDLIIISLLNKDINKNELLGIIKTHNVQHAFGWSNKQINFELNIVGYPHGVLFDRTGNLINVFNIDELTDYCESNFNK